METNPVQNLTHPNPDEVRYPAYRAHRLNVHILFSAFHHASRALREGRALIRSGSVDEVLYVAYSGVDLPDAEILQDSISVVRIPVASWRIFPRYVARTAQFIQWSVRVIFLVYRKGPCLIIAHNLATLPVSVALKRLLRVALIYDAHELETERPGWPRWLTWCAKMAEKVLIRDADHTICVSEGLRNWYARSYVTDRVTNVMNLPERPLELQTRNDRLRTEFAIPSEAIIFLYQGVFGRARGIEELLKVFAVSAPDRHVVFMGFGPLENEIREGAKQHSNIHIKSAVPSSEVLAWTSGADVGLALIADASLSYRLCLPNKLFETVTAGVPVVVSARPEMANMVRLTGMGWIAPSDPDQLLRLINELSLEEIARKRDVVLSRRTEFFWDRVEPQFVRACQEALRRSTNVAGNAARQGSFDPPSG